MPIIPQFKKTKKSIIAIDPGIQGAIVFIYKSGNTSAYEKSKTTNKKLIEAIRWFYSQDFSVVAYIEDVHAMPKNGAVSMFNFGKDLGWYNGILDCLGILTIRPAPLLWQNRISISHPKDITYGMRKKRLLEIATNRFGKFIEVTKDNCDALLIGQYASMMES